MKVAPPVKAIRRSAAHVSAIDPLAMLIVDAALPDELKKEIGDDGVPAATVSVVIVFVAEAGIRIAFGAEIVSDENVFAPVRVMPPTPPLKDTAL